MKHAEEIMNILEAFDLTRGFRAAGELAGCDHHTVAHRVARRDAGELTATTAGRARLIDEFLSKVEEWMEASNGKVRAASAARPMRWLMPLRSPRRGAGNPSPTWTAGDLKRPGALLAAVLGLLVSVPLSLNASCQAHEIGHALVGTALGWEVERIHLCLPTGGSVQYASTSGGSWADAAESFAGGITGALFLVAVYMLVFYVPKTPLRGPALFGAGFGPVLWIGTQLLLGMVEGTIRDRDYGQVLDANPALTLSVVLVTMLAGAAAHIWLWRSVWTRQAS